LAFPKKPVHFNPMARPQELETQSLSLTDSERALFASRLPGTVPAVPSDDDEGVSEATRRDRDLDANPGAGLSWEDLKKGLACRVPATNSKTAAMREHGMPFYGI
jgi:hypothetical protein